MEFGGASHHVPQRAMQVAWWLRATHRESRYINSSQTKEGRRVADVALVLKN